MKLVWELLWIWINFTVPPTYPLHCPMCEIQMLLLKVSKVTLNTFHWPINKNFTSVICWVYFYLRHEISGTPCDWCSPDVGSVILGEVEKSISKCFTSESGETLEWIIWGSCGSLLHGSVQGQVGQGPEQPSLAEDVPAHGKGAGIRSLKIFYNPNSSVTLQ